MLGLASAIPYVLAIATILAGGLDLYHRWAELREKPLRKLVPILFVLIGLLTLVSLHYDNTEKQKADQDIQGLKTQVQVATKAEDTAIRNQKDNTATFLSQFQRLSGEVADLKTKVQTAALQKRLATVQGELEKTQKALAPAPKATLLFSFVPFSNPPLPQLSVPSTDVTLPVRQDGSVHVQFALINNTAVDALDGDITLQICDHCRFAKEPAGFTTIPGERETQRYMTFDHIFHVSHTVTMDVDVTPLPDAPSFKMGVIYRCRTCVADAGVILGTVYVSRP